jgi:signal transduction histidine kinase
MSVTLISPKISRSVAWRLAAGVLPSVLAVGLVVGLVYYGQAGRAAPEMILVLATALTLVSVVVAWINARYFAARLARIAGGTDSTAGVRGPTNELDRIEQVMGNLGTALSASEAERARTNAQAAAHLKDEATMLAGVAADAIAQLDGVRLPLQILLESPFGELNENQEELLRDARTAADAIDIALRRLAQVADVDRDAILVQHELVQVNDVVRSILPLARAAAERRGARIEATLEPGLPRVAGDRARLAEALTLLVADAAEHTTATTPLSISTRRDGQSQHAMIRISPYRTTERTSFILASRLIAAQSGRVSTSEGTLDLHVG